LAIAASAVPSFILALVHRIESILELSLVVSDFAKNIEKTSTALEVLKKIGAYSDAEKAKENKRFVLARARCETAGISIRRAH